MDFQLPKTFSCSPAEPAGNPRGPPEETPAPAPPALTHTRRQRNPALAKKELLLFRMMKFQSKLEAKRNIRGCQRNQRGPWGPLEQPEGYSSTHPPRSPLGVPRTTAGLELLRVISPMA